MTSAGVATTAFWLIVGVLYCGWLYAAWLVQYEGEDGYFLGTLWALWWMVHSAAVFMGVVAFLGWLMSIAGWLT